MNVLKEVTGNNAGTLTRTLGKDPMLRGLNPENLDLLSRAVGNNDQTMNRNLFRDVVKKTGLHAGTEMNPVEAADVAFTFFVSFSPKTQKDLMQVAGTPDFAKALDERWTARREHLLASGINKRRIDQLKDQGTKEALRGFLQKAQATFRFLPSFANMKSVE